ncbi:programmed cell death protein 2 [Corythoichthys intestinalis]|uniref:programmed cell death protein 2 n=1 Tax=Corythoichthys intestinalis TaxID=161448 RepID=UPI0025A63EE9|nr:programmed cell death protein 2 [Corythoichthys intestinalis]XP_061796031.1 programmed cell death protein 2 [Nerophis lumbriciformis]
MSLTEVVLGFLDDAEPWRLRSPQFPSKVGGKPAWLCQRGPPSLSRLECETCRLPMAFLLQVYAPIPGQDRSFHRTLFVFCCKSPECYTRNDSRCVKVFRSQLPRKNDFYSYEPPQETEPLSDLDQDQTTLPVSGVKLCWVCGCPGNKACSRCHSVTYCGKHHQTLHWKHSHKKTCGSSKDTAASPFLFVEFELLTETEEEVESGKGDDEAAVAHTDADCPTLAEMLAETDLEEMAMHETEDNKVFQRFKKKIAPEPQQVLRYSRGGSPLWVSSQHIPSDADIPVCTCGAKRIFEFQVMPQLLNSLHVDSTEASIDWGTLAVYTCSVNCNHEEQYCLEYIWKQDFSTEQQM